MREVEPNLRVLSSHFYRTDVEVVIHSDNDFASVSYLRIKGATLENKPDRRDHLIVPPLLEANFARIESLMRDRRHSADPSIHAYSEPGASHPVAPPHGPSRSRRGDWVAVGDVCCMTSQGITFEEEVIHCFRALQGISTPIKEVSL